MNRLQRNDEDTTDEFLVKCFNHLTEAHSDPERLECLRTMRKTLTNPNLLLMGRLNKHITTPDNPLYTAMQTKCLETEAKQVTVGIVGKINSVETHLKILQMNMPVDVLYACMRKLRVILKETYENSTTKYSHPLLEILNVAWHYAFYRPDNTGQTDPFVQVTQNGTWLLSVVETKKIPTPDICIDCYLSEFGLTPLDCDDDVYGKIRALALCLIRYVINQLDNKTTFNLWSYLIYPGSPSLRQIINDDASPHAQIAAFLVLHDLLAKNIIYIEHAEKPRTVVTSFTSFSETLGMTVLKIHDDLLTAMDTHAYLSLVCLRVLIKCTPYKKMAMECLTVILKRVTNVLGKALNDEKLLNVCLRVVFTVVNAEQVDVAKINDQLVRVLTILAGLTWVSNVNLTVILEIFRAVFSRFFTSDIFGLFVDQIKLLLNHDDDEIRLETLRLIEVANLSASQMLNEQIECVFVAFWLANFNDVLLTRDRVTCEKVAAKLTTKRLCAIKSIKIYHQPVAIHVNADVRKETHALICDCLGSIHEAIFVAIPADVQTQAIMHLQSEANDLDNDKVVRGAAIRALSRGILQVKRVDDEGFVADMLDLFVRNLIDMNGDVRVKASWALSNLTGAIVANHRDGCLDPTTLTGTMLCSLFNAIASGLTDTNKVKCNIIRAAGDALQISTFIQIDTSLLSLRGEISIGEISPTLNSYVDRIVDELMNILTTSRDMKMKWNACRALGTMLEMDDFYANSQKLTKIHAVFGCLLHVVEKCNNFKVRINAILSLSKPPERKYYGDFWPVIFRCLVKTLHGCCNVDNFKEYQHKETLIEQIALTLAHLIVLGDLSDIDAISDTVFSHYDVLFENIARVYDQAVPERAAVFQKCGVYLKEMVDDTNTGEVSDTLNKLASLFNLESVSTLN